MDMFLVPFAMEVDHLQDLDDLNWSQPAGNGFGPRSRPLIRAAVRVGPVLSGDGADVNRRESTPPGRSPGRHGCQ